MKARGLAFALAVLAAAGDARADEWPPDFRLPLRFGFGYDGQLRAPALRGGIGVETDVAQLARGARLVLGIDFDLLQRFDVPSSDPNDMKLRLGASIGAVLRPTRSWALVLLDSALVILMPSPDDPGSMNVVGGGLAATAYVYPWYVPVDDVDAFEHSMSRVVVSGLAAWARGEADWTSRGHGGEISLGVSIDLVRFLFSPAFSTISRSPPPRL